MRIILLSVLVFSTILAIGQSKNELNHEVYPIWNSIQEKSISNNGEWVKYRLQPGKGNPTLKLINEKGEEAMSIPRGANGRFSWDSEYLLLHIKPHLDSVNSMKRRKVDEKKLPKDSLAIIKLSDHSLVKIPGVNKYNLPQEWSGWVVYELEDSTDEKASNLIIRELETGFQDTLAHVLLYKLAKKKSGMVLYLKGDSLTQKGVYVYDFEQKSTRSIYRAAGSYVNLSIDDSGTQYSFMIDLDTAKHLIPTYQLAHWNQGMDSAQIIMGLDHEKIINKILSEHDSTYFSKNGKYLFFGISPKPILQDTLLLEDEITTVEVWSYTDSRLHTQQNIEAEKDRKKSYLTLFDLETKVFSLLATETLPEIRIAAEENNGYVLGISNLPYLKSVSWEGYPLRYDLYQIDIKGNKKMIRENVVSHSVNISPFGKYAYWYDAADTSWNTYSFAAGEIKKYGTDVTLFANELNDLPHYPGPYGSAGWTQDDGEFIIYDRYDLWVADPKSNEIKKITAGRSNNTIYRYMGMDPKIKYISTSRPLLLKTRNDVNEKQGFASIDLGKNKGAVQLTEENMRYNTPLIAHQSDKLIYSKESFRNYPDLILTDLKFKTTKSISDANPQQKDYKWGSAEIYRWTSLDGVELKGILVKPDDFDPNKKYPLLVNFYERSSDDIHNHRPPTPGRSTISYSFYASKGYIIFNPDVPYRIGYPGESCYNAVIPGVTSLIEEGFIDKERIGVQGHSWGGYQVAYLVTKTDLFKCAEAGAPVPNMISAYGGIRWWTGLSRMFQYEHTQSRIGGTLWEYPIRYIENSPIFFVDKINTPLLIMHNDKDGHVPWYQGIEFFVSLRRLGKPSWMLNYSGEPHWPLEWKNRVDFNIRMQQFFDHYLLDSPKPKWMSEGIPAIEKGINLGYELEEE